MSVFCVWIAVCMYIASMSDEYWNHTISCDIAVVIASTVIHSIEIFGEGVEQIFFPFKFEWKPKRNTKIHHIDNVINGEKAKRYNPIQDMHAMPCTLTYHTYRYIWNNCSSSSFISFMEWMVCIPFTNCQQIGRVHSTTATMFSLMVFQLVVIAVVIGTISHCCCFFRLSESYKTPLTQIIYTYIHSHASVDL